MGIDDTFDDHECATSSSGAAGVERLHIKLAGATGRVPAAAGRRAAGPGDDDDDDEPGKGGGNGGNIDPDEDEGYGDDEDDDDDDETMWTHGPAVERALAAVHHIVL